MPRTLQEARLQSRGSREKLAPGERHYRSLGKTFHLGYRRRSTAENGRWFLRLYAGAQKYRHIDLESEADDLATKEKPADGHAVLSYEQAEAKARQLFVQHERRQAGLPEADDGPYTVRKCIAEYLEWTEAERKSAADARRRANAIILPELGDIACAKLTKIRIDAWKKDVASSAPRLRSRREKSGEIKKQNFKKFDPKDAEAVRRRRATTNRTLTILKAALNRAWREGKIPSDDAWRRVEPFEQTDAARLRYLTIQEAKRLVNAAGQHFRPLVEGALATGARYGELSALDAHDFNPDSGTLHIRVSKGGKGRHIVLNKESAELFERLTAGKAGNAPIFSKANGERWAPSDQLRPMGEASRRAKLKPAATFHSLRHTWASLATMAGMPLMVVARNLGHSDTRMVEKHYGHLAPDFIAEAIRASAPVFGFKARGSLRRLEAVK